MIARIIPFFLLASVPEDTTWNMGPEYMFSMPIDLTVSGWNETSVQGYNATNMLLCRPLDDNNSLRCHFKHLTLMAYTLNPLTGETKSKEWDLGNEIHLTLPFDISFNNKGVFKLTITKNASTNVVVDASKAIANLLNVGMNLDDLRESQNGEPVKKQEMNSFLLGECKADMEFGFYDEANDIKEGNWDLELDSTMNKLSGRKFRVSKLWDLTDCSSYKKFLWAEFPMYFDERELKMTGLDGMMTITRDSFESKTIQKAEYIYEDINLMVTETASLFLDDVRPATEEWPEIKDPTTLMFSIYDTENEAK